MKHYAADGRDAVMEELAAWLKEYMPAEPQSERKDLRYVKNRIRENKLREQLGVLVQRARISVAWRTYLSLRLKLSEDEVVRATNTVIELMERELSKGRTVRLADFGDFKPRNIGGKKSVLFQAAEDWKRGLNEPLYDTELGLKRSYIQGRLKRRA